MSSDGKDCGLYWKGTLKKKTFLGIWQTCFCELQLTEFYIRKTESTAQINKRIPMNSDTIVNLIETNNGPILTVQGADNEVIYLKSDNEESIFKWVIALRSATFYNASLGIESFNLLRVIGRGFYGKVTLVSKKDTGEHYALKTIHKARIIKARKLQIPITELNILKKLRHPFIVNLKFAFQSATKFYLGLEYVPGGDLKTLITRNRESLTPNLIRLYVAEVALALNHMHSVGVLYRDLKPENLLINNDGHLKVTDFGLSEDVSVLNYKSSELCGTAEYVAPEVIKREHYSYEVDWWGLGILTYELFFGVTPFFAQTTELMYQRIVSKKPLFPIGADSDVVSFVKSLLKKDPKKRANFEELKGKPFWGGLDFEKVANREYVPDFIPLLEGPDDVKYFDEEFTDEKPCDSPATPIIGRNAMFTEFDTIEDLGEHWFQQK